MTWSWIITGSILRGTGVQTGAEFVANWATTSAGSAGAGRTVYSVQSDGRLLGHPPNRGFLWNRNRGPLSRGLSCQPLASS